MAKKVKKIAKKKKSPQKKTARKVSKKKTAKKAVTKEKKAAGKAAKPAIAKKTQDTRPKARRPRKLTPTEIEGYRRLLLEKWAELLGDVNHIEKEALRTSRLDAAGDLSSMPIHMADLGTDNFEQEFALGLMDSDRKILTEIQAALQRIDQGTFGICEGTGRPIAKARLNANPWARYCIDYARMVEEGLIIEGEKIASEEQEHEAGVEDSEENRDDVEHEAQDGDNGPFEEQPDDEDEDA